MIPFFFRPTPTQLYGVYHAPVLSESTRLDICDKAVLICPPIAQEYLRTHWILRQIATKLAQDGYHVLRFDYSSTGNSCGETESGSISAWERDVAAAAEELLQISAAKQLIVVGVRLGAAVALLTHLKEQLPANTRLVLWDPVVDGQRYLTELNSLHTVMVATRPKTPKHDASLVGFLFTKQLRKEISDIDLMKSIREHDTWTPHCSVLVESEPRPEYKLLSSQGLSTISTHASAQWSVLSESHEALLSSENVKAIVDAIKGA